MTVLFTSTDSLLLLGTAAVICRLFVFCYFTL